MDFDPYGAPGSTGPGGRNPQNRGVSGYEPISWDDALDIVAAEIKRVKREHGPGAILSTPSSHHMWGNIGYRHSTYFRFMNLVGFTYGEHNPDSWEGWHWGATHMWGQSHRLGLPEQYDLLEDALKQLRDDRVLVGRPRGHLRRHLRRVREHAPAAVAQGARGEDGRSSIPSTTTPPGWWPTSGSLPRPGTDVALALAIAYVWLTEGTYDKEYVAARTVGFDQWKDYVLGAARRRRRQDARSGPRPSPASPPARSGRWRASGRQKGRCSLPAATTAWAGPAARPRATSGPGPWWPWPPCRAWASRAATSGPPPPARPVDCSFVMDGYAEGGISGDVDNTAAGFRWVYRMFPQGGATRTAHHSTEGPDRRSPAHPRGHDGRAASNGGARASAAAPSRASSSSTSIRRPATRPSPCTTATAAPTWAP